MQTGNKTGYVNIYAIAALMCYLIINQGGYFAGGIISAGIIVSIMLCFTKIRLKMFDVVFFLFCIWYLFCSVKPGFNVRYFAKGMLPMLCLMFRFMLPSEPQKARELCVKLLKISFYIAAFSIFVCMYKTVNAKHLLRLTFPFQYANGSGIFFALMFILSRHGEFDGFKRKQYVFFIALVLTQSVGAIGVTVLAEIFLSRNIKRTLVLLAVLIVGAVFLKARVYQSIGTFIERFLQMRDAFSCMVQNPFFGIGAGRWEVHKNLYQSGFYDAKEIHSSIFQIAAASGIVGVILFIAAAAAAFYTIRYRTKIYPVALVMIIGHSALDFTLSFAVLGFLAMLMLSCCDSTDGELFEVGYLTSRSIFALMTAVFITLGTGMYQIKKLDGIDLAKNYPGYIEYYEAHPLSQKSRKTAEDYAKALYATGKKKECLNAIEKMNVLSSDMIILKKGCTDDWREVIGYLELQPYNPVLYKTVYYHSDDKSLPPKAKDMLNDAKKSMSYLGKILFEFKGEKII